MRIILAFGYISDCSLEACQILHSVFYQRRSPLSNIEGKDDYFFILVYMLPLGSNFCVSYDLVV